MIQENTHTYLGKPVVNFTVGDRPAQGDVIYRLYQDYDAKESQRALVEYFFSQVSPASLQALVLGVWNDPADDSPKDMLDVLVERRAELAALRSLFVGDISSEENEISWIVQCDYKPLLDAFPQLESLRIRGGSSLAFPPLRHDRLVELAIETGGLPSGVVDGIAGSTLPALRRLELWLGDSGYGFSGGIATYRNLLERIDPSRLSHLGLRNAEISDELAAYVAKQPWLEKIDTLDLSMGTIGDDGAKALFESPYVRKLKTLDLSHHYIGAEWQAKLRTLPIEVLLADEQDAEETDGDRYVEVSE